MQNIFSSMSVSSRLGPRHATSSCSVLSGFLSEDGAVLQAAVALQGGAHFGDFSSESDDFDAADLRLADKALRDAKNAASPADAFQAYNYAAQLIHNNAASASRWILPALFDLNLNLYNLAVEGDKALERDAAKPRCLEEAARTINKAFSICATDRFNSIQQSRKWGVYYICNLLFRTYFRLNQINLASNLIRSFKGIDLPDLDQFPTAHVVTYRYYMG
ncbi:COP9 signalosome (CSN) subunit, partial [Podochytrium sp. JEL0797]